MHVRGTAAVPAAPAAAAAGPADPELPAAVGRRRARDALQPGGVAAGEEGTADDEGARPRRGARLAHHVPGRIQGSPARPAHHPGPELEYSGVEPAAASARDKFS